MGAGRAGGDVVSVETLDIARMVDLDRKIYEFPDIVPHISMDIIIANDLHCLPMSED